MALNGLTCAGVPLRSYSLSVDCSDGGSEVDVSSPLVYGTPSSRVGDTPRTPGALGTPHRLRADIRSERRPTVTVGASSELVTSTFLLRIQSIVRYVFVLDFLENLKNQLDSLPLVQNSFMSFVLILLYCV